VIPEKLNRSAVLHSEAAPGNVAPVAPNRRDSNDPAAGSEDAESGPRRNGRLLNS
jgi:hypothetical protein